jgi:hypothetical protein
MAETVPLGCPRLAFTFLYPLFTLLAAKIVASWPNPQAHLS